MASKMEDDKHGCAEDVAWLRANGYRITPQRMQVLTVLKTAEHHITAEEIHAAIIPQQPFLDLATVYRTLHWLQSVDLVVRATESDGIQRYEYRSSATHHHHLVCQKCKQDIEITQDMFADLKQTLNQRYGFVAQFDHAVVSGYCITCHEQVNKETA